MLLVVPEDRVIDGEYGAAAVAEYGADALVGQDLDEHVRPGHGRAGQRVGPLMQHVVAVFHR